MKRINSDGDPRCVAVIEPVQRAVGTFMFNAEVDHICFVLSVAVLGDCSKVRVFGAVHIFYRINKVV